MTILSERPLRRPVCALKLRNNVLQRGRSRWPCGLRSEPATVWLLGSRFQIALRTWMFVPCVCLQCVGSGLCDELIIRSKTFYQLCLCASACVCVCVCVWVGVSYCVWSTHLKNETTWAQRGLLRHKNKSFKGPLSHYSKLYVYSSLHTKGSSAFAYIPHVGFCCRLHLQGSKCPKRLLDPWI